MLLVNFNKSHNLSAVVRLFIENKMDINAKGCDGETAIDLLRKRSNAEVSEKEIIIQLLLANGANR